MLADALSVFLGGVLAFLTLLVFTRILGKKQISQPTFFDYITGITIGSTAAILTTELGTRAVLDWVALLTWSVLAYLSSWLTLRSRRLAKVMDGEPTIVVHNGKIPEDNMARMRFRMTDLMEQLRHKGVFSLTDVEFAILETDGQVSAQKKSQAQPVTPQDLGLATELV